MNLCSFNRPCVVCGTVFDYRDRGGKNTVTCSEKCSRKHTKALRRKAQRAWKAREKAKSCKG